MVGQRDIAEAAGVSVATVSTVLANKAVAGGISRVTEARVQKVARSLGYVPNMTARGLRKRKHYTIGLLLHNPTELLYAELLTELQSQLTRRRYAGVSAFWHSMADVGDAFQSVVSRGVDGIITCHDDLSLVPREIPVITFEGGMPDRDGITRNGPEAVRDAFNYLLGLGHRRFGMINMDREAQEPNLRGILGQYPDIVPPVWIADAIDSNYLVRARQELAQLLSLPRDRRPTALICRNDTVAMQALSVAGMQGLQIPHDLSVIGFDNTSIGAIANPPLTTFGTPPAEIAQNLVELMWYRLKQPEAPVRHVQLKKRLVVRHSCGVPPCSSTKPAKQTVSQNKSRKSGQRVH